MAAYRLCDREERKQPNNAGVKTCVLDNCYNKRMQLLIPEYKVSAEGRKGRRLAVRSSSRGKVTGQF